jgi:hypothetical protein
MQSPPLLHALPALLRRQRRRRAGGPGGSDQAAAPIHRIHHSNEHPVGGAKIGHAEDRGTCTGCWHAPPSAHTIYRHRAPVSWCWRHKLLAPGRQRARSVPPDHLQRKNKGAKRPITARWYLHKISNWLKQVCQMGAKQPGTWVNPHSCLTPICQDRHKIGRFCQFPLRLLELWERRNDGSALRPPRTSLWPLRR